jgi:hypothetical protein
MKTLKLLVAWSWVALPLAWGVWHSVLKSAPLFRSPPVAAPVAPPATVGR